MRIGWWDISLEMSEEDAEVLTRENAIDYVKTLLAVLFKREVLAFLSARAQARGISLSEVVNALLKWGRADQTAKVWDVATSQERATLRGHPDTVLSVAFSPDGKTLASVDGGKTVKLWNVPPPPRWWQPEPPH